MVSSRYYSPELGRFIQPADISSLNIQSINGLNLYIYVHNNPISYSFNNSKEKNISTDMNAVLHPNFISEAANNSSANPLSFSVGLLTPEKYDMPS